MMRIALYLIVSILFATSLAAQNTTHSKEVEEKIKRVENSLAGWVKLEGNTGGWNLQDRMKTHNIHGVSVAVVHNYKVEWAKGYGFADTSDKRPVATNTLFQAASISKSLNAMAY